MNSLFRNKVAGSRMWGAIGCQDTLHIVEAGRTSALDRWAEVLPEQRDPAQCVLAVPVVLSQDALSGIDLHAKVQCERLPSNSSASPSCPGCGRTQLQSWQEGGGRTTLALDGGQHAIAHRPPPIINYSNHVQYTFHPNKIRSGKASISFRKCFTQTFL